MIFKIHLYQICIFKHMNLVKLLTLLSLFLCCFVFSQEKKANSVNSLIKKFHVNEKKSVVKIPFKKLVIKVKNKSIETLKNEIHVIKDEGAWE